MLKINDIYRSTEVMRWHIVKTKRKQSVAEHSYIVTILVREFCCVIRSYRGDLMSQHVQWETIQGAMFHDVDEVLFGDIPSPSKRFIDTSKMADVISSVGGGYTQLYDGLGMGCKQIIKLADLVEAVKFLTHNKDSGHADKVLSKLNVHMMQQIDKVNNTWCIDDQVLWHDIIQPFLYADDFTVDDLS
ncbi:YfbR-like 5'-deoxynucleotidase [Zhongshania sp.]|uniref:YfbR-like 5'-deoxynucleotidase n=1 Tax=Zhongshania sp. TaxID=1971902 RepID=UPI00356576A8